MIKFMVIFISLYGLSGKVIGADTDTKKQTEVVKQYYQNLLNNKPEKSYQLLSAKDKNTYTEEQFVRVIKLTALYDPNRIVTIKDTVIEESEEGMAVVKIFAELSTNEEQELQNLTASQIVVYEDNNWKVYAVHMITSILIRAKTICDSNDNKSMPLVQKERACYVYYGHLKTQ